MTEVQFQAARKVMQSANYTRGLITAAKGEVAKWTAIEDGHRRNFKHAQADGAKKNIDKAIKRLAELRKKFADMKFPDENVAPATFWVVAIDTDSFNYEPVEHPEGRRAEAIEEGFTIYATKAAAQNECDALNAM
jgi:hypothetical protein